MKKLRVGLIGLGNVAVGHLQGYTEVNQVEVVAGTDLRKDRVSQMAKQWKFNAYTDYDKMINSENLDIVCILTPPGVRRQITESAAESGVHILCEKPITLTLEDAKAMITKCNKEGVKLFYGSCYRFLPACMKAKELIDTEELGELSFLLEMFIGGEGLHRWHALPHYPAGSPGGGGYGLIDHGIHLVDIFRWFTGSEVETVFGRGIISGDPPTTEYMTLGFKNGTVGQLLYNESTFPSDLPNEGLFSWGLGWGLTGGLGTPGWDPNPGSIRVHGSRGALRIFHYANKLFFFGDGQHKQISVLDRPHPGNFGLQMESFANSILLDEEPEVSGIDGLKALQLILAAYESFETQNIVSITSNL